MADLKSFIYKAKKVKSIDNLSTDGSLLFNFLALIVDIKYRNTYGNEIEQRRGKGYSSYVDEVHIDG